MGSVLFVSYGQSLGYNSSLFYGRTRTKKRLIFPGKPSARKKKKKKNLTKSEKAPQENEKAPDPSTPSEHHDAHDDIEEERTIRKSTRTAVIVKQAEREAIRAALQATMKVWCLQYYAICHNNTNYNFLYSTLFISCFFFDEVRCFIKRHQKVQKRDC